MKLENYKAGEYTRMDGYKAFILSKINYNWGWEDSTVENLLAEASSQIGELNAYSMLIPKSDIYIKMLARIEANKSSKIAGIDADINEQILNLSDILQDKQEDCAKVQTCFDAILYGNEKISQGEVLSAKIIKDMNGILTGDKSSAQKSLGKFRNSQIWAGGEDIANAVYVPPPHTEIIECLVDFEKFITNDSIDTPDLAKLAMLHYQFESVLHFVDGNGRVGRMFISQYLQNKGILAMPCLYISDFIEKNKSRYFDMMTKVRNNNDMISWIKFFLEVLTESAKGAKEKLKKADVFSKEMEKIVNNMSVKPDNVNKVLDVLYDIPVINLDELCEKSKIKAGTMRNIILGLIDKDVLTQEKIFNKSKIITFKKYIDVFK